MLTDEGVARCEELLKLDNLFDPANITAQHHVMQSLKAHQIFKRDVDYIVQEDQVIIVDEFTGRLMAGRRYSDGLHQALEAKEHVTIAAENQTLASITFQNYFRLYDKLSGMYSRLLPMSEWISPRPVYSGYVATPVMPPILQISPWIFTSIG